MTLAYVAGPYRSKDGIWGVKRNVESAMSVARELWKQGYAVICPHGNTALMDGPDIDDEVFLKGDLAMLERCDLIVMLPGWECSAGACAEASRALEIGIVRTRWDEESRMAVPMIPPGGWL